MIGVEAREIRELQCKCVRRSFNEFGQLNDFGISIMERAIGDLAIEIKGED